MPDNLEAIYQLKVENGQLNQALDAANAKLAQLEAQGNKTDASLGRLGQGMKSVDDAVGKATRTFTKFLGAFGAIGATAAGAYALGTAIRSGIVSALETGEEKAKRFHASLDFTKPAEALGSMESQLAKLNSNLAAQAAGGGGWFARVLFGEDSPEELKAQIDDLNKRAIEVRKQLKAQRDQKEDADEAKRIQTLEKARDDARSASLEGQEKIEFDSARRISDLKAQLEKERNDKARAALEETISWEHQKRNQALADLAVKEQREKERAADELKRKQEQADKEAADALHSARMAAADEEGKAKLQLEHDLAELQRKLDKETNDENRRMLMDAMQAAADAFAKKMDDIVKKLLNEMLKVQQQLLEANNNIVFGSLSAIQRSLDDMKSRIGP